MDATPTTPTGRRLHRRRQLEPRPLRPCGPQAEKEWSPARRQCIRPGSRRSVEGYSSTGTYADRIGNMTSKTEGGVTYNFTYDSEHIHAPDGWRGYGNTYDKNGNATQVDHDLNWYDVENRFSQVNYIPNSTTYLYDASGEMVRRKVDNLFEGPGTEAKETFFDGLYQEQSTGGAPATYTKYYTALGRVIAKRTGTIDGSGNLSTGTLTYTLSDHLGSTTREVQSDGTLSSAVKYWPFGAARDYTTPPERGYTGQQQETTNSTGMYYYHARFYSTAMGRFVSADAITPTLNSGGLNRYAYTYQNPIRYNDEHGFEPTAADVSACASDLDSCLRWSFGVAELGLVIVLGLTNSNSDPSDIALMREYIIAFFDKYPGPCGSRAGECYSAFETALTELGAQAAYDIFGVMMIESDKDGHGWRGIGNSIPVIEKLIPGDRGYGALDSIITDPRGKMLVGVIGLSLGAGTVAKYFQEHPESNVPFFLDSPAWFDPWYLGAYPYLNDLPPNYVGSAQFFSCEACGPDIFLPGLDTLLDHGPRGDLAVNVMLAFSYYWIEEGL